MRVREPLVRRLCQLSRLGRSFEYLGESCLAGLDGRVVAGGSTESLVAAEVGQADLAAARQAPTHLEGCKRIGEFDR